MNDDEDARLDGVKRRFHGGAEPQGPAPDDAELPAGAIGYEAALPFLMPACDAGTEERLGSAPWPPAAAC